MTSLESRNFGEALLSARLRANRQLCRARSPVLASIKFEALPAQSGSLLELRDTEQRCQPVIGILRNSSPQLARHSSDPRCATDSRNEMTDIDFNSLARRLIRGRGA